ncbi:hypothetical protein NM208_g5433 [Fusarium decemcellulare]|uniref:Uncharacterized protein n=1 Tax=Fusarium decemcellulare TaxID=57161 RepID=A0ACC1SH04_9HYPO|nr:hypothetical protein NM208_g5433 [Fusarium decemcellulare]
MFLSVPKLKEFRPVDKYPKSMIAVCPLRNDDECLSRSISLLKRTSSQMNSVSYLDKACKTSSSLFLFCFLSANTGAARSEATRLDSLLGIGAGFGFLPPLATTSRVNVYRLVANSPRLTYDGRVPMPPPGTCSGAVREASSSSSRGLEAFKLSPRFCETAHLPWVGNIDGDGRHRGSAMVEVVACARTTSRSSQTN